MNKANQPSFQVVAKCIPYGKGLKGKAKQEAEKVANTLNRERQMLAPGLHLTEFPYRPRLPSRDYFGRDEEAGVVYLVMERLDQDLAAWAMSNAKLTSAAIANKGLSLLAGLQWLHNKGFLFIDVKPENFMLRGDEVVFIDCKFSQYVPNTNTQYSICTSGVDGLTERIGQNVPVGAPARAAAGGGMNGTPAYVSLAVHAGAPPSQKDDIEAMV